MIPEQTQQFVWPSRSEAPINGKEHTQETFDEMVLKFIAECNGPATPRRIKTRFLPNFRLSKAIRNLRESGRIVSARGFDMNGTLIPCYKAAHARRP